MFSRLVRSADLPSRFPEGKRSGQGKPKSTGSFFISGYSEPGISLTSSRLNVRDMPMIEWLPNTASPSQVWTLISTLTGVVAGFLLNAIWQGIREWWKNRRLKDALYEELDTLLHQIEQKKDVASKMIAELENGGILPGNNVPAATVIYDNHFDLLSKHINTIERDNIHNIYTRIKFDDEFLSNFERLFKEDVEGEAVADPWKAYKGKLENIIQDYEVAQALIERLKDGDPKDIYHRRSNAPRSKRRFAGKVTPDVIRGERADS